MTTHTRKTPPPGPPTATRRIIDRKGHRRTIEATLVRRGRWWFYTAVVQPGGRHYRGDYYEPAEPFMDRISYYLQRWLSGW